mgnify:FL=1|tara:strand:- start:2189 stop:2443 length:255 start_codon:yes stop_codon:yes gene_type:complete
MKKFILSIPVLLIFITFAYSQESNCKGGKLSKEFLSCKAKNLKSAIIKTDENFKKSVGTKFNILKKNTKEVGGNFTNKVKKKIN